MLGSFNLFGKEYGYYAVLALVGVLVAGAYSFVKAKKSGLNEVKITFLLLFSALGVLAGGHLLYGITNIGNFYLLGTAGDCIEFCMIAGLLFGGQVFYGGLLGGIAAGAIYAKVTKLERFGEYADIVAAAVPLFHFFGRIGCFLGGCCYGIESDFGFTFHHSLVEAANGVNRFPVQLFEAGFNLLLFVFILTLLNKKKLRNRLFFLYLFIYAIGRFILEYFRGDSYRGFLFGLSTSQIISLMILVVVSVYSVVQFRKNNKSRSDFNGK